MQIVWYPEFGNIPFTNFHVNWYEHADARPN